jgi:hypothetical protein
MRKDSGVTALTGPSVEHPRSGGQRGGFERDEPIGFAVVRVEAVAKPFGESPLEVDEEVIRTALRNETDGRLHARASRCIVAGQFASMPTAMDGTTLAVGGHDARSAHARAVETNPAPGATTLGSAT